MVSIVNLENYARLASETNDNGRFDRAFQDIAGGGTLIVPAGQYIVSKEFALPEKVNVKGQGLSSVINQTAREFNIFVLNNGNTISSLTFEGDYGVTGIDFSKNNGIFANNKHMLNVEHCYFSGFESSGIQFRNIEDVRISNNYFSNNIWGAFSSSSDITLYSSLPSKRVLILNNFCHSNNSQGIFVNALGYDSEININGNICSTLNPDRTENTNPTRRHGIVFSYNGGLLGSKVIVSQNLCKNTLWSGIYGACLNNEVYHIGEYIITDNHVINTGLQSNNSISGGILLNGGGLGDVVANNVIENVIYAPGIKLNQGSQASSRTVIHHNTIKTSYDGIYVSTNSRNVVIESNNIIESVMRDIYIAPASTSTSTRYTIRQNYCRKSNPSYGIFVDSQYSDNLIDIANNEVIGPGNMQSNSISNTGIYVRKTSFYKVANNYVEGYYYGFYYEDVIQGRIIDKVNITSNTFHSLAVGCVFKANNNQALVLLEGNRFINVATKASSLGSYLPVFMGQIVGDNIIVQTNGAPAKGTFKVGDRFDNITPVSGGIAAGVCIADGSPGTWTYFQLGLKSSISSAPSYVGEKSLVNGVIYEAINTASPSDWKAITN